MFNNRFSIPIYAFAYTNFQRHLIERKEVRKNSLKNDRHCGEDYLEFVLLALVYFIKAEAISDFTSFNKPGALHKPRLMAKLLYAFEMHLLGLHFLSYIPKDTSSKPKPKLIEALTYIYECSSALQQSNAY